MPRTVPRTARAERARQRMAAWRAARPGWHRGWVLGKYGLTVEGYEALLLTQNGGCALCGGLNPSGQRLAVDHDHVNGVARGLLCHACNTKVGRVEYVPTDAIGMALYLGARKGI